MADDIGRAATGPFRPERIADRFASSLLTPVTYSVLARAPIRRRIFKPPPPPSP